MKCADGGWVDGRPKKGHLVLGDKSTENESGGRHRASEWNGNGIGEKQESVSMTPSKIPKIPL